MKREVAVKGNNLVNVIDTFAFWIEDTKAKKPVEYPYVGVITDYTLLEACKAEIKEAELKVIRKFKQKAETELEGLK